MLKAIHTTYNGTKFRSRLEARWAYFLDELQIAWEYEPGLVDLGSGLRYLPDFRTSQYWLEIKGEIGTDCNGLTIVAKCDRLAKQTSLPVVLAFYDPFAAKCAVFTPQGLMTQAHFGMCAECGGLAVKAESMLLCSHPNPTLTIATERQYRHLIFNAAVAARDLDTWSHAPMQ